MSYISSISQELKKLYFLEVVGSGNKTFMILEVELDLVGLEYLLLELLIWKRS